jgi:Protein of unknown function (DUF1573)
MEQQNIMLDPTNNLPDGTGGKLTRHKVVGVIGRLLSYATVVVAVLLIRSNYNKLFPNYSKYPLTVDSPHKSFGAARAGDRVQVSFNLTNLGTTAIRVLGSEVDCTCMIVDDRSFTIAPGVSVPFRLRYELLNNETDVKRKIRVFTNIATQPEVELTISGRCVQ